MKRESCTPTGPLAMHPMPAPRQCVTGYSRYQAGLANALGIDLGAPGPWTTSRKSCLALLTLTAVPEERQGRLDDWQWLDQQGLERISLITAEMLADPDAWWADLAERNINLYSSLRAALALGHSPFTHVHQPSWPPERLTRPTVPWCHGDPMYLGPTGWWCRVRRTWHAFREEESSGS